MCFLFLKLHKKGSKILVVAGLIVRSFFWRALQSQTGGEAPNLWTFEMRQQGN